MRRRWLGIVLLLAGCSFFSRTKNQIYTIDPVPPAAAIRAVRGVPVAIDVVQLPPGADRREIAVRQANQKLDVRGTELWSTTLQPLVLQTLAVDLAKRLPEGMVVLPGETKPAAMRSIDVVFEDLAPGPASSIAVDAQWKLRESGRPDIAHHEQFTVDVPSLDSANIASGMSQALAMLADRIAAQL